jgi:LPS O-antigen subunit length determinant protein (WzzB/FepE family)
MPDLISVFARWWKFILGLSLLAVVIALLTSLLSPKKYLSVATALPANSLMADKARVFNSNIEALYSDFGTSDELDKLEGTAALDTLFIATAKEFDLAQHYEIKSSDEALYKAVIKLKKNSHIARSGYGELKIKVWDEDRNLAAALANDLLQKIQELHQHLQNENNKLTLKKLREDYFSKQKEYKDIVDTLDQAPSREADIFGTQRNALLNQLQDYKKIIGEYELAISYNPPVLLTVEPARASIWSDKPKTLKIVLFTLAAAFACSFLLAVFLESRKTAM